jgi:diaminohydroxyphosphoribosylaminopyrimidine deaminase/5-amino-6-(5-phosphoribosylamino)uracil reductase
LVRDGVIVGRGWTQAGGRPHAEAHALADLGPEVVQGADLYVTLEPCAHDSTRGPACADIIAAARPQRVIIGVMDPDPRTAGQGIARLEAEGIRVDLLNDRAAERSLAGFLSRQRFDRPYVTLKLAMSLDGCIALADGTSQWITGTKARAHVHAQRARHHAILVGGGTWRTDKPRLDVRLQGLEGRSPERVLLTRGIKPDGIARIINTPSQIAELDAVDYLYIEGGAATAASFLKDDLVDELHIYQAPILIGQGLSAIDALELSALEKAHGRWHLHERRQLGSDTFTAYLRNRS